jgi:tryptophan-rich sensory protein
MPQQSSGHGVGYKSRTRILAGLWFAATGFLSLLIVYPLEDGRFKGKGTLWILPGALSDFWDELVLGQHDSLYAFLPFFLLFGAIVGGWILNRRARYPNSVAAILGSIVGSLTMLLLIFGSALLAAIQDQSHDRVRAFLFLLFYLWAIWGFYNFLLAALLGAGSGLLLYRVRVLAHRVGRRFALSRSAN